MDCETFRTLWASRSLQPLLPSLRDREMFDHLEGCDECDEQTGLSCADARMILDAWLDGENIPEIIRDRCDVHITTCDSCDEQDLITCDAFRTIRDSAPDGFSGGLRLHLLSRHRDACPSCHDRERGALLVRHGVDPADYPCLCTAIACLHLCELHEDAFSCPDTLLVRTKDGRFGLPIRDGGKAMSPIDFCPWCGTSLDQG